MTEYARERSIGARIAAARRARGFRSTRELAAALAGTGLTESVLENIELGRRSNIDVSHILNIARTLGVPVSALLAPISRPGDPVDLPNLGPGFDGMTAAEFDSWLSATPRSAYVAPTTEERSDRAELQALRELIALEREHKRLEVVTLLESEGDEPPELQQVARAQAQAVAAQIQGLRSFLLSAGWDL